MAKQEKNKQDVTDPQFSASWRPEAEEQTPVPSDAPPTQADLAPGQVGSVVDSAIAAASATSDEEVTHIYNEDTREMRQVTTRAGYAPAPMPFGFRLATAAEIAAYKATQDKE